MVEGCEGNGGVGSTGMAPLAPPAAELIALVPPLAHAKPPIFVPPHLRLVADEL